jgi:hypothetical protein
MVTQEESWTIKFKIGENLSSISKNVIVKSSLSSRYEYYELFGLDEIKKEIGKISKMSIEDIIKHYK